ncbi:unnamed protein product [Prorocentrum cordatum]|uniref:Uncharacterized protein n=1 Tax=Prorocentrum cordatum TaxID=2364126 RepID=A0ABN9Q2D7_9DINO|nr:unnamed protein product [Polarella glacialis]
MVGLVRQTEGRFEALDGRSSAAWSNIDGHIPDLRTELRMDVDSRLVSGTATPAFAVDADGDDRPSQHGEAQIRNMEGRQKTLSTPPSSVAFRSSASVSLDTAFDDTYKLIVLGFLKKMLQPTLRTIGESVPSRQCAFPCN